MTLSFFADCEIPNKGNGKTRIEGSPTDIGEYPWQVSWRIFLKIVQKNIKSLFFYIEWINRVIADSTVCPSPP